jgi:hypothetical protein
LAVINAVDFDKLDLVAIFGGELLDDLVPGGHELDAVAALRHEEVDDDEGFVASGLDVFLEVL